MQEPGRLQSTHKELDTTELTSPSPTTPIARKNPNRFEVNTSSGKLLFPVRFQKKIQIQSRHVPIILTKRAYFSVYQEPTIVQMYLSSS